MGIGIAGAGVGGLSLALALSRKGFEPVIFEKRTSEQVRGEGIFLTLAPNGLNALRALDLADRAVSSGLRTDGIAIHNERGKRLALADWSRHAGRFGAPSVTIRRGALSGLLLDAAEAADIDIRFGNAVEAVENGPDGVVVRTAGGKPEPLDALIGCDGLRSTVRRLVFPELPQPHYSGLIGTGGVTRIEGIRPTNGIMNMTFGRRAFFGYIATAGEPVMWFDSYPAPEDGTGPIIDPEAYARFVETLHRDDPLDNARILAAVPALERNYPIYDMPELEHWSKGSVLLVGDAAHAIAPHSGQGASMAMEDAIVLAAALAADNTIAAAFARFFTLRRARTREAIRVGRLSGSQKHAQSAIALFIRDLLLPIFLPLGVKAQERLFRFRADLTPLAQP